MPYLNDNNTYNLLTALQSVMEAHDAYGKFAKDGHKEIWDKLSEMNDQAYEMLYKALKEEMNNDAKK